MSSGGSSVRFEGCPQALDRAGVRRFARSLSREVAQGQVFHCLITGDERLRELNRTFRGKDKPTDVLSFPSAGIPGFLGDIAISADRAQEQAGERGHTIEQEISILLLHGVLHLMGHDHETDGGRMAELEADWRKRLRLPLGLIERAGRRK